MCDYCFPPHNPSKIVEATSVAAAYPSIKPPPPGVPVNALAATQILLDLIAELRDRAPTYGDALTRMADHYESRLREVTSDE